MGMPDAKIVDRIRKKYNALVEDLDERGRRRWAASEAESIGYGGITAVAAATGMSDRTIRTGIKEIREKRTLPANRQRRRGGGRKRLEAETPELVQAVEDLVEPMERGDPESPLRWTCKSLRNLQQELQAQGYSIGRTKISQILRQLGYSLQGNRKTREGKNHPDRDAQFEFIGNRVKAYRRGGARRFPLTRKRRKT